MDKVEHLRRAAEHLTAAGKPELAEVVSKEALIEEKLERIRQLQAEVAALRGTRVADQTVTLHVKILELPLARMRKLGFDLQAADKGGSVQLIHDSQVKSGAVDDLIAVLQKNDLVKVLAEPTLVTMSDRPATFQSGGEFPIVVPQSLGTLAVEYRQFGTRLDCTAKVLDDRRIRLDLRSMVSELDNSRSVTIQDRSVPALRSRCVDSAVEMVAGETIVLSGVPQIPTEHSADAASAEQTALLVTVKADLGEPIARAEPDATARY